MLEDYQKTPNPDERPQKFGALVRFLQPVALPMYKRGQFKRQPGKEAKFYP